MVYCEALINYHALGVSYRPISHAKVLLSSRNVRLTSLASKGVVTHVSTHGQLYVRVPL